MRMKVLLAITISALLLSSCNLFQVVPRADIVYSLIDSSGDVASQIRVLKVFERDEDTGLFVVVGYVLPNVRIQAQANPGSIGVVIERYAIDFFMPNGMPVPTDSGESFRGLLGLRVPAGVRCEKYPSEEEPNECMLFSEDAVFAPGVPARSIAFSAIATDVIGKLDGAPAAEGAFARIIVEGRDANGNSYSAQLSPVTIAFFRAD